MLGLPNIGRTKMWKNKSEVGYHTVYYCPSCRSQKTFHTVNWNLWKCAKCNLKMLYDINKDRLKLT